MKKSKVKDGNYYTVQGFMVRDLKLKGLEKDIYAIIYGFSQLDGQVFNGSLQYLSDWTCSSKQAILNAIKKLIDKGLIKKKEVYKNGVKLVEYSVTEIRKLGIQESCIPLKKVDGGIQETLMGGIQETLPNNISLDNIINNKEDIIDKIDKRVSPKIEPNNFTKELIKNDYIKEDDLYIDKYNDLFDKLLMNNPFDIVRSALWYLLQQVKQRQGKDENGKQVENRFAYLKNAMEQNINRIHTENRIREKMNNKKIYIEDIDDNENLFGDYCDKPKVGSWLFN